tara:strand:- start:450 stop:800 length:351 start_codon:yes stop_codon:yes gene_type:complete
MANVPLQDQIVEGSSVSTDSRILVANFGDGYNQRTPDGINHLRRTMTIQHKYLTATDATTLRDFYEANGNGVKVGCDTKPTDGTTRNWYIDSWSESIEGGGNLHNFSATLVQVFEA